MGFYINPKSTSKEEWLKVNAIPSNSDLPSLEDKQFLICLVDNGPFTAAGICYDEHELEVFICPSDLRSKNWFLVDQEKIFEVLGEDQSKRLREVSI